MYWLLTTLTSKYLYQNSAIIVALMLSITQELQIHSLRRCFLEVVLNLVLNCVSKFCRNYIYKLTANTTYPSKVTILDHSFRLLVNRATYTFEYKSLKEQSCMIESHTTSYPGSFVFHTQTKQSGYECARYIIMRAHLL